MEDVSGSRKAMWIGFFFGFIVMTLTYAVYSHHRKEEAAVEAEVMRVTALVLAWQHDGPEVPATGSRVVTDLNKLELHYERRLKGAEGFEVRVVAYRDNEHEHPIIRGKRNTDGTVEIMRPDSSNLEQGTAIPFSGGDQEFNF